MSCVNFSLDSHTLITRSMDDTLKLWDMRSFKKPVSIAGDLPLIFEEGNAIFSPNDRMILAGTSVRKGDSEKGRICFFDKNDLSVKVRPDVGVEAGSVVRLHWNGKINQILASTSEGAVQVFYDPFVSVAGAKLCASKKAKSRAIDDLSYLQDESARYFYLLFVDIIHHSCS